MVWIEDMGSLTEGCRRGKRDSKCAGRPSPSSSARFLSPSHQLPTPPFACHSKHTYLSFTRIISHLITVSIPVYILVGFRSPPFCLPSLCLRFSVAGPSIIRFSGDSCLNLTQHMAVWSGPRPIHKSSQTPSVCRTPTTC